MIDSGMRRSTSPMRRTPLRPHPPGEVGVAGGQLSPARARAGCGPAVDPGKKRLAAEKGIDIDRPDIEAALSSFGNQSKAGRMDYRRWWRRVCRSEAV